mmetsp:Transcript_4509/g.9527  ORF Transcript_4509/g.9527 Transcript_4509/m.9527 type:complete len:177 (-) Transcript_4509:1803-2333(-)
MSSTAFFPCCFFLITLWPPSPLAWSSWSFCFLFCLFTNPAYMPPLATNSLWFPCSMAMPLSITTIESAFITVDSLWATSTTVALLSAIRVLRACCTASWLFSSKADVASSSKIIFGFLRKTRAIAIRCRWPPLSRIPLSPILVSNPSFMSQIKSYANAFLAASIKSSLVYSSLSIP